MTFRVSYMTGECWETFRDGFTCSTNPHEILDADWSNSVTCLKYSILIGCITTYAVVFYLTMSALWRNHPSSTPVKIALRQGKKSPPSPLVLQICLADLNDHAQTVGSLYSSITQDKRLLFW